MIASVWIVLSVLFSTCPYLADAESLATQGTCYKGSSSSSASDYPPTVIGCNLRPIDPATGTSEMCYLRKVKDLDFYEMGCTNEVSCQRMVQQVADGTDLTYSSADCCVEVDLCNDYQNFQADGTGGTSGSSGLKPPFSTKEVGFAWGSLFLMCFCYALYVSLLYQ
jgi:hypothetical protein